MLLNDQSLRHEITKNAAEHVKSLERDLVLESWTKMLETLPEPR
jgi:hypothetical protein